MDLKRSRTISLTDEDCALLDVIGDEPLRAVPELRPYVKRLEAMQLIELNTAERWQLTSLGYVLLERRRCVLH